MELLQQRLRSLKKNQALDVTNIKLDGKGTKIVTFDPTTSKRSLVPLGMPYQKVVFKYEKGEEGPRRFLELMKVGKREINKILKEAEYNADVYGVAIKAPTYEVRPPPTPKLPKLPKKKKVVEKEGPMTELFDDAVNALQLAFSQDEKYWLTLAKYLFVYPEEREEEVEELLNEQFGKKTAPRQIRQGLIRKIKSRLQPLERDELLNFALSIDPTLSREIEKEELLSLFLDFFVGEVDKGQKEGPFIEIYTMTTCPYCKYAKELLDEKGVEYIEYDLLVTPEFREESYNRSGKNTVPQIFINQKHIGGFSDLKKLDESGELQRLLAKY